MREIGGYFGLEGGSNPPYHSGVFLNSGRHALRYVIRSLGIKKLHVPHYTCPVVWQAIEAEECSIELYDIDDDFMPTKRFAKDDFIVYNNYFGVMGKKVADLAATYPNLIVDNAQAFYSKQIGRAAFYSPRKFFGLPDGGIAVFKNVDDDSQFALETDVSCERMVHLVKRIEFGAEAGYQDFKTASKAISELPVRHMSKLTRSLMGNINFDATAERRRKNFAYLQQHLPTSFPLAMADDDVPMVYPLMTNDADLRPQLVAQKVYVASYWPGLKGCGGLQERILPLPLDQRYEPCDLDRMIQYIHTHIEKRQ